eukprot:29282-Pelagococcus_subviridis.AAC.2
MMTTVTKFPSTVSANCTTESTSTAADVSYIASEERHLLRGELIADVQKRDADDEPLKNRHHHPQTQVALVSRGERQPTHHERRHLRLKRHRTRRVSHLVRLEQLPSDRRDVVQNLQRALPPRCDHVADVAFHDGRLPLQIRLRERLGLGPGDVRGDDVHEIIRRVPALRRRAPEIGEVLVRVRERAVVHHPPGITRDQREVVEQRGDFHSRLVDDDHERRPLRPRRRGDGSDAQLRVRGGETGGGLVREDDLRSADEAARERDAPLLAAADAARALVADELVLHAQQAEKV